MDIFLLESELNEAREAFSRSQRLERHISRIDTTLAAEKQVEKRLREQLPVSAPDLYPGKLTFTEVFTSVLGRRAGWIDRRRQEALVASLRLDNCQRQIAALEHDREELTRQRAGLSGAARRCEELVERQRIELTEFFGSSSDQTDQPEKMIQSSKELSDARMHARELREALLAGEHARTGLSHAVLVLQNSRNCGAWDLFGAGTLAIASGYQMLDEAYASVQEVQTLLYRFERELDSGAKIAEVVDGRGGLANFADIVAEALLVDLLAQCEICEALEAADAMAKRVDDLMAKVASQSEVASRAVRIAEANRRDLLKLVRS